MYSFLIKYRTLVFGIPLILIGAKINQFLGMGLFGGLLFLLALKDKIQSFFILFICLLLFSDSRQTLFDFAQTVKPMLTLLLPLYVFKIKDQLKFTNPFIAHFLPYFIIAWLTLFLSPYAFTSFQKTLSYTLIFICIPILFGAAYQKDKDFFKDFFIFFTFYLVIGVLLHFIFPNFVQIEKIGRFNGLLGNPNGLGIFITLSFLYYQAIIRRYKSDIPKAIQTVFLIALFISLFWSKSRTSMMTILIFYSMNYIYHFSHFIGWITFSIMSYFYQDIIGLIPQVTKYLGLDEELRVESVDQIKKGSGRQIAWIFAWEEIKESPVLGKGIAYTESLFAANYKKLSIMGHQGNAHNTYLTMWLDTGLIGVGSFFIGLITYFIRLSKRHPVAMPILFSCFFSMNYESWLSASLNPFTSIFLCIGTYLAIASREDFEDEKEGRKEKEKESGV